ncbi:hypothetical protein PENVUL_c039G00158 [Penicillium vulpinum]|uniref:Uncharacterized protein n=1 Tax=Penicillium vulpinum TaxID=29845 RepID=A0A1V6RMJ6_9EURO|nr:hypothetical protein PENVUL_c039G00158 [Penicillium vulpinum]
MESRAPKTPGPTLALKGPPGAFKVELLIYNGWSSSDHWAYWVCSHKNTDIGVMIHTAGDPSIGFKIVFKRCHNLQNDPNPPLQRVPLQWIDGKYFDERAMLNNEVPIINDIPVCRFEATICKVKLPEKTPTAVADASAAQLLKNNIFNKDVATYLATNSTNDSNLQQEKKGFDSPGSWIWEVGAGVLSAICVSALVGFLQYLDGKTYDGWQYGVSPNAVVATIATIAKGAALVAVSSCLSQLKWNRCQVPTALYDLQILDQASRGPWGSLNALWTVTPGLATVGALLMVSSVALGPFTQQILTFPSRSSVALNATASVQMTHEYSPDRSYYTPLGSHDPVIEESVLSGISAAYTPVEPHCSTGDCEYPDFITLGICSKCEDVTSSSVQNCSALSKTWSGWEERGYLGDNQIPEKIPLNCTYTTPNGVRIVPGILYWNFPWSYEDNRTYMNFYRATWTSVATEGNDGFQGDEVTKEDYQPPVKFLNVTNPIIQFISAKYLDGTAIYTTENLTAPSEKPILTECALYYCEQQYTQNNVSVKRRILQPTRTHPLRYVDPPPSWGNTLSPLGAPDGTNTISGNSTYGVAYYAESSLRGALIRWLNTTNFDSLETNRLGIKSEDIPGFPASSILFDRGGLNETFSNIARSITDTMRANSKATKVPGQAFQDETYIHVRWEWVIPPIVNVVVSIGFLAATAILCRRSRAVLWKSSVLPFLLSQVDTHPEHDLIFRGRVDEVEQVSKIIKVSMKEHNGQIMFTEH